MKTTIGIFLALALPVLSAAAYADPPARVARLNHISGTVRFAPAEAPGEWSPPIVNRPLIGGDRLWTGHGARAELHVGARPVSRSRFRVTHSDLARAEVLRDRPLPRAGYLRPRGAERLSPLQPPPW